LHLQNSYVTKELQEYINVKYVVSCRGNADGIQHDAQHKQPTRTGTGSQVKIQNLMVKHLDADMWKY
jgi:hypothetical protein